LPTDWLIASHWAAAATAGNSASNQMIARSFVQAIPVPAFHHSRAGRRNFSPHAVFHIATLLNPIHGAARAPSDTSQNNGRPAGVGQLLEWE
jgi:hypothetical protein